MRKFIVDADPRARRFRDGVLADVVLSYVVDLVAHLSEEESIWFAGARVETFAFQFQTHCEEFSNGSSDLVASQSYLVTAVL
jgi:hypothetical protein